MNLSILKKIPVPGIARRHPKKSIAGGVVLLLVLFGMMAGGPAEPEYLTETAQVTDLRQTVEAVGTVISERELELRFAGVGIVSAVNVKEGDRVRAGQRLAQLRGGSLGASIASQSASLQSALADLRAMEEGTRPEDIAVAEADLAGKRASLQVAKTNLSTAESQLQTLRQEVDVNLSGQVSTSMSSLSQYLVNAENALSVIDDVLDDVDVQDAIFRNSPGADNVVRSQKDAALSAIVTARLDAASATDYQTALTALATGRTAALTASTAMDQLFALVSSLNETTYFSNADRESHKNTITAQRAKAQDASSAIATLHSGLQNASASYDTKISAQESARDRSKSDILTYEASIRTAEAQLALKRAGSRPTDIDAARARVRAAQANLARAQADYSDTVLVAPIAGTITHVNVKIGESLPAGSAMTLLGDSPFRVEMFVSEIDVPKLQLTQSGSIELDAFRGTQMKLALSEVDSSPTVKDGVSKYGIKLDFLHLHPELKIGMTGDAEVVTGTRTQVVAVPRRGVLEKDDGTLYVRVLTEGKPAEKVPVTIGMEGESGDVEILSGLKGGETVIVLEKK